MNRWIRKEPSPFGSTLFQGTGLAYARLEVKDSGEGIDPENLPNIFNPFYSTKESSLGLGLPIVHKVIAFHRGQIEVDNHPGEGVTFIITSSRLSGRGEKPESWNQGSLAFGLGLGYPLTLCA